jgi:hypothetical protein
MQDNIVKCLACGSDVEQTSVVEYEEYTNKFCVSCILCENKPNIREAYKRGFNDGLDATSKAVKYITTRSNLRKK